MNEIVKSWTIGRLTIAIFRNWIGIGYRSFYGFAHRFDSGWVKFWWQIVDTPEHTNTHKK